jgi:threonyl-tRNA synthetase
LSELTITLPDGSTKSVPHATTVGDIAVSISPRLAQAAYAGMVNDRLVDLTYPVQEDAKVRILTSKDAEALTVYRHSAAHLLAAAVTQLFPECSVRHRPPNRRRVLL